MKPVEDVLVALQRSAFRRRFRLLARDLDYVACRTIEVIESHARCIIHERLGPARPHNDGKQTPMRGHPVFVAQHATATCCRGCLHKWHRIPEGRALSTDEEEHAVAVITSWINVQMQDGGATARPAVPQERVQLTLEFED